LGRALNPHRFEGFAKMNAGSTNCVALRRGSQ
jgi:hypothetical protein